MSILGVQCRFQLFYRPVLQELHRAFAFADGRGHLLDAQFFHETHYKDVLVVGLERKYRRSHPAERELHLRFRLAFGDDTQVLGVHLGQGRCRALGPVVVDDLISRDLVKPAREGIAQMPIVFDVLPGRQEYLMGEVLSFLTQADLDHYEPVYFRLVMVVEQAKSRGLTPYGAFNYLIFAVQHRKR